MGEYVQFNPAQVGPDTQKILAPNTMSSDSHSEIARQQERGMQERQSVKKGIPIHCGDELVSRLGVHNFYSEGDVPKPTYQYVREERKSIDELVHSKVEEAYSALITRMNEINSLYQDHVPFGAKMTGTVIYAGLDADGKAFARTSAEGKVKEGETLLFVAQAKQEPGLFSLLKDWDVETKADGALAGLFMKGVEKRLDWLYRAEESSSLATAALMHLEPTSGFDRQWMKQWEGGVVAACVGGFASTEGYNHELGVINAIFVSHGNGEPGAMKLYVLKNDSNEYLVADPLRGLFGKGETIDAAIKDLGKSEFYPDGVIYYRGGRTNDFTGGLVADKDFSSVSTSPPAWVGVGNKTAGTMGYIALATMATGAASGQPEVVVAGVTMGNISMTWFGAMAARYFWNSSEHGRDFDPTSLQDWREAFTLALTVALKGKGNTAMVTRALSLIGLTGVDIADMVKQYHELEQATGGMSQEQKSKAFKEFWLEKGGALATVFALQLAPAFSELSAMRRNMGFGGAALAVETGVAGAVVEAPRMGFSESVVKWWDDIWNRPLGVVAPGFGTTAARPKVVKLGRLYDERLGDMAISREHGSVSVVNGRLIYMDSSRNGTTILTAQGQRYKLGSGQSHYLSEGDGILLSDNACYYFSNGALKLGLLNRSTNQWAWMGETIALPRIQAQPVQHNRAAEPVAVNADHSPEIVKAKAAVSAAREFTVNPADDVDFLRHFQKRYGKTARKAGHNSSFDFIQFDYGRMSVTDIGPKVHIAVPSYNGAGYYTAGARVVDVLARMNSDLESMGLNPPTFKIGRNRNFYRGDQTGKDITIYFNNAESYNAALPYLREISEYMKKLGGGGERQYLNRRIGEQPYGPLELNRDTEIHIYDYVTMGIRRHAGGRMEIRPEAQNAMKEYWGRISPTEQNAINQVFKNNGGRWTFDDAFLREAQNSSEAFQGLLSFLYGRGYLQAAI